MPCALVTTKTYSDVKEHFIKKYSYNSNIESIIKKLERRAKEYSYSLNKRSLDLAILFEDTNFVPKDLAVVGCLCLVNCIQSQIAPCIVFFASERAVIPLEKSCWAVYVKSVKDELLW